MSGLSLNIGLKSLLAAQAALDTIGHNVSNVNTPGYEPRDLDVTEFADLMTQAISEHIHSQRLLLCDGKHIHFGREGSFETNSIPDDQAAELLATNSKEYLQYQTAKLSENLLNSHVAGDLLNRQEILDATPRHF